MMQSQKRKPNHNKIRELIRQFQENDDESAQERLVAHYQPLVAYLAKKYSNAKTCKEDLIQVGMIGLFGAIRRFDLSSGKPFETYAVPTIIGEMKRHLRDKTWSVHVPRKMKELGSKINSAVDELTKTLQRSPKVGEIADYLEEEEEDVLQAMEIGKNYQVLSVDHSFKADKDGGTTTILDVVGQNEIDYEHINQKLTLESALPILTERERKIIQHSFYHNRSQKEIGKILGISQMHVSRLLRQALKKLKKAMQNDLAGAGK